MKRYLVGMSLLGFVFLAVMSLAMAPAFAQGDANGGPICTEAGDQTNVKVVADGSQGMYVLWYDTRPVQPGLYLKRVGQNGLPPSGWPLSGIRIGPLASSFEMVLDPQSNKAVIVWSDGDDLFAQRVTQSGAFDWTAVGSRIAHAGGLQLNPSICPSPGALLVAFETRQDLQTPNNNGVHFQRVRDYDGYPMLGSGGVIVSQDIFDRMPVMTWAPSSGAIIAFQRPDPNGAYRYFAQKVDETSGARMWQTDVSIEITGSELPNESYGMSMIPDGSAGAYCSWTYRYGFDSHVWDDVVCARLLSGGTISWRRTNAGWKDLGNNKPLSCVVPATNPLGATFVWPDFQQATVMATRMRDYGAVAETNGWYSTGNLVSYAASPVDLKAFGDGSGGFLATWAEINNGSQDVFAQKMQANGVYGWNDHGKALTQENHTQNRPGIATDGLGGALVAWQDQRNGPWDIYGQRVDLLGQLDPFDAPPMDPITITAPVGGEHWSAGSTQTVTWTGSGTVNILASPDDGLTWPLDGRLAQGVTGGSASVTVPQWNSTLVRIEVFRSNDAGSWSQSGLITVLKSASLTWSIQETSHEDIDVNESLAMALGPEDSPNILFSSMVNGKTLVAKPVAGWWYPENPLNQNSGVRDASAVVDATGNLHLSYFSDGNSQLWYMTRVNGVWNREQVNPTLTLSFYSSLRLSSQGMPYIARIEYVNNNTNRLVISKKGVNGWEHDSPVPTAVYMTHPSLAMVDTLERVTYTVNGAQNENGTLRYAQHNSASPLDWAISGDLGTASYTSLAVDAQGNPKVAWYDPATKDLMYRERINDIWSSAVRVDSTGTTGQFPSLALDAAGNPRIAYYGNGVLLYSWRNASGVWSTTLVDGSGDAGTNASLALNPQGNPRIAYLDVAGRRPRYAVSPTDNVRPNDVQLSVTFGSTTAFIQWNAPGDDGTSGQAVEYDLRYAPNQIGNGEELLAATRIPVSPPGPAGQLQAASVNGLTCGQAYAFVLMTRDESCNWGGSNMATGAGSNCGGGGIEIEYSSGINAPATLEFSRATSNPSRGQVRFRVGVPVAGRGAREELLLFDVTGRLVRALVSDAAQPGWRDHVWDGRTDSGSRARTGVYFVRYRLGQETRRQTIVVTN